MKCSQPYLATFLGIGLIFGLGALNARAAQTAKTYIARLVPLNTRVTRSKARGELRLTISGDKLTISLSAQGLPPGMMHMVHLHGFADGKAAACPGADADTNHDGIIDLNETEPAAGVTLIPLNGNPAALEIASSTYPVASKSGRISYHESVSLAHLNQKVATAYQGASLDLAKRVVFIHGVPSGTALPKTVASLPGVPAQVTLPIACGKIVPAR